MNHGSYPTSGLAYENISAFGPNGGEPAMCETLMPPALPHYSPEKGKDSVISKDSTYVM